MAARSFSLSPGLCCSLALLCPGAGRAAEELALPPVVVPLPSEQLPPQAPQKRDPTGALTVMEVEERRGEAKETAELLATAPGVVVQDAGGLGQSKLLSVRGAAPNGVLVLLDGVPLNGAGANLDLSRIPAAIVERLELLRGGAGARYGSGGLGGVLNVVTRRPKGRARLHAQATRGSFSTSLLELGASAPLHGGEGLLLLHGAQSAGDFPYLFDDRPALQGNPLERKRRENNQATAGGLLLRFSRPGSRGTLDGLLELSYDSRGLAGTVQNPTPDAGQESARGAAAARWEHPLAGGELAAFGWGRSESLRLSGGLFGADHRQLDSAAGAELSYSRLLGERHGLSATAQASYEWLSEPSRTNPRWVKASAMAQDEIFFAEGAVALVPSLRLDRSGPFSGLSPKLGLFAGLPGGLELRANLGQAHRAPSFLELYVQQGHLLPNEKLRPERALFFDLALLFASARAHLSLGGFHGLYQDLITYEYYPPMLSRPFNISTARAFGLEAEGEARPHPLGSLALSYTLLFSQNLRDDPRYYLKELPYRPRHKLHARAYFGPSWARPRAELLYQSEQFQNRTATLSLPARALVNAGLSSQLLASPRLELSLEAKNLFDVQSQDLDGYPLPPRAGYLTVAIAYDKPKENQK